MATELGETGCKNTSKREPGGKGKASQGGGSGGGNTSMAGLMVVLSEASRAAVQRQEEGEASMELRRIELRGWVAVVDVVCCGDGGM
jgi:hypothetical protein